MLHNIIVAGLYFWSDVVAHCVSQLLGAALHAELFSGTLRAHNTEARITGASSDPESSNRRGGRTEYLRQEIARHTLLASHSVGLNFVGHA